MILALRTDKPDSEVYVLSEKGEILAQKIWPAHRQLSENILKVINELLKRAEAEISYLGGMIIYKGPGSFTGLRIGFSVANAIGYAQNIPVVATTGEDWLEQDLKKLPQSGKFVPAQPEYGGEAHITQPRK